MKEKELLIQAIINRSSNRLIGSLRETLTEINNVIETSPEKIKNQWEELKIEIEEEFVRLKQVEIDQNNDTVNITAIDSLKSCCLEGQTTIFNSSKVEGRKPGEGESFSVISFFSVDSFELDSELDTMKK